MAKATYIKQLLVRDETTGSVVSIALPAEYVYVSDSVGTLAVHVADVDIHLTEAEKAVLTSKNAANGILVLTSENKIPVEYVGDGTGGLRADVTFATIAERDAANTSAYPKGQTCFVIDATGDSSVEDGWAIYRWTGTVWTKIMEGEAIDPSIWDGSWDTIIGKPQATAQEIDDMVAAAGATARAVTLTENPAADIDGFA